MASTAVAVGKGVFDQIMMCKKALHDMEESADNMDVVLSNITDLLSKRDRQPEYRDSSIQATIEDRIGKLHADLVKIQTQRKSTAWKMLNLLGSCVGQGHVQQIDKLKDHKKKLCEIMEKADSEALILSTSHLSDLNGGAAKKKIRHAGVSDFWVSCFKNEFVVTFVDFKEAMLARYKPELEAMFASHLSSVMRLLKSRLDTTNDNRVSLAEVDAFFCPDNAHSTWDLIDVLKYHLTDTRLLLPALCVGTRYCGVGSPATKVASRRLRAKATLKSWNYVTVLKATRT